MFSLSFDNLSTDIAYSYIHAVTGTGPNHCAMKLPYASSSAFSEISNSRPGEIPIHVIHLINWKHFPRPSPLVPGEFPTQWPVTPSFGIFFDQRLNKLLSKQS